MPTMHRPTRGLAVSLLLLAACSVELRDQTPPEQPWHGGELAGPDAYLYPGSTPQEISTLGMSPRHRFLLEVRPGNVSNIQAYITVNGTERRMQGSGAGLWTFESPDECQAGYSYHYRVRYRAAFSGSQEKTLGSAVAPLSTTVTGFGEPVWFQELGVPSSTDGEVHFVAGALEEATVVVQNLRSTPIVPYSIALTSVAGAPDNSRFQVLDVPVLPRQLDCGESLSFKVRWVPPSPTSTSTGALGIWANPVGGAAWFRTLTLRGHPHPG